MEELADSIFTCTFKVEAKRYVESLETYYKNERSFKNQHTEFVMDNCPCLLFSLLQGLWYGIRCLSTLSDIGCRRQQSTWLAVSCVVRGASPCLEEKLSWMIASWENTPQLRRKPDTTCSTIKVRAYVWNVTQSVPSWKSLSRDHDHWFEEIRLNADQECFSSGLELVRSSNPA